MAGAVGMRGLVAASGGGGAADTTAPTLTSATVAADGYSIALLYDETLDSGSVPAAGDYALAGTNATIDSVGISGDTVTLTLAAAGLPVTGIQTVTLDYTAGANPVQDAAGNDAANLSGQATANNSTVEAPRGVANLVLFVYSGAGIVLNAGKVETWEDQAGTNDYTQATAGSRPTVTSGWRNGEDALSGGWLRASSFSGGSITKSYQLFVGEWATTNPSDTYVDGVSSNRHVLWKSGSDAALFQGTTVAASGAPADGVPFIEEAVLDGANGEGRIEPHGAAPVTWTGNTGANSMNGATILASNSNAQSAMKAAAHAIYSVTPSAADRADLRAWAAQKYNVVHA